MIEELDERVRGEGAPAALSAFAWLGPAIDTDRADERFALWARSSVIDENVGAPVISRAAFEALHARAGLTERWPVGNAGLLHTYGYLLSTTPTPYGLKRERWLDGRLAHACGLAADAFVPWAGERTLLARVTEAGHEILDRERPSSQAVGDLTALLGFRHDAADGPSALVYALAGTHPKLVTLFPVADPDGIRTEFLAAAPRLRWNAAGL